MDGFIINDEEYDYLSHSTEFSRYQEFDDEFFQDLLDVPEEYVIELYDISDTLKKYTSKDEKGYYSNILFLLNKLSTFDRNFKLRILVYNMEIFRNSNILNNIPKNVSVSIMCDSDVYSLDEYLKQEEKIEKLVAPIRDSNLSPFEKCLAVYNVVKNFKDYKDSGSDITKSRRLKNVLDDDNEYLVCVGFSKLLNTFLHRIGISSMDYDVDVDTSITSSKLKNVVM